MDLAAFGFERSTESEGILGGDRHLVQDPLDDAHFPTLVGPPDFQRLWALNRA